jgi:hypothetical protein
VTDAENSCSTDTRYELLYICLATIIFQFTLREPEETRLLNTQFIWINAVIPLYSIMINWYLSRFCFFLLVVAVAATVVGSSGVAGQSANIIVGETEEAEFNSIQRAISSADNDARIEVQPGNYQVSNGIYINKDITLIAPRGATINIIDENSYGIYIGEQAKPEIAGFTITGHTGGGVAASDTTKDWLVRDMVITGGDYGIQTFGSTGDWVIRDVTVRDSTERGLSVDHSTGEWTISSTQIYDIQIEGIDAYQTDNGLVKDVIIRNIGRDGINLYDTESWTIKNVTIKEVGDEGINAGDGNATATQVIRNTTIRDTGNRGISFYGSNADWTVTESIISNTDNVSIEASETKGDWSVTESSFPDGTGTAIEAIGSDPSGEATDNYWGSSTGPSGDFSGSGSAAIGNVDVGSYYNSDTSNTNHTSANSGGSSLFASPLTIVFGGAIVGPVFGYGLYRLIIYRRGRANPSNPASNGTTTSDTTAGNREPPSASDNQSTVRKHRDNAETAVETAVTAKSNNNLNDAADAYTDAISEYQAALDTLEVGATAERTEIEEALTSTRADLETIKTHHEQRSEVIEALQPAERSLQEAIVAYIQGNQTVARIRFRQARDTFEDAHETLAESERNLFTDPIEVTVQPDRELSSGTLNDLAVIPETAATELADAGIETVEDLGSGDESPWTPATVEELVASDTIDEDIVTSLTLLSWWHGDETYEFDTTETIERRHEQADYGFNCSS